MSADLVTARGPAGDEAPSDAEEPAPAPFGLTWPRPGAARIAAALARPTALSYQEVGASAHARPPAYDAHGRRYDADATERVLGHGEGCFARAAAALFSWRHFDVPWVALQGRAPVHEGQVVATLVTFAGASLLNPCRVVYVEPSDGRRAAFAYGTLQGHVEQGEERFEVAIDPHSGEVRYRISAFSRPASWITRLGYPLARRVQQRFARASADALVRAVDDARARPEADPC